MITTIRPTYHKGLLARDERRIGVAGRALTGNPPHYQSKARTFKSSISAYGEQVSSYVFSREDPDA